ncbi:PepSY domain-containing protein [Soonwooa sp.]|uniref:PepSY domain-containing protein n=1 Tax=Soonwooa sp. TaxID=1938592 RepID=UPI0026213803|nr:PepSY domain-containing protein [Soonwooa sp.]
MKYFILQIHKWLGLLSGIVVFIVSITGAIFTFQDNIKDSIYDYRKVSIENKAFLKPSQIISIVQKSHPDLDILRIMYMDKDRSTVVMTADAKKDYYMVYVNPYSGSIMICIAVRSVTSFRTEDKCREDIIIF